LKSWRSNTLPHRGVLVLDSSRGRIPNTMYGLLEIAKKTKMLYVSVVRNSKACHVYFLENGRAGNFIWVSLIFLRSYIDTERVYIASKPITRRLVVSAPPVVPTPDTDAGPTLNQNPPRHSYSKDFFKHKFTPYGSTAISQEADVEIADGDVPLAKTTEKKKKRSRDADPPKKAKKMKAARP
jgi:hypothetical protein